MKAKKILSIALAAMLVLSLMPLSYAQPPGGKVPERYKVAKADYINAMEAYKNARQDYLRMKEVRGKGFNGVTLEKAKNFLLRSIEAMVARLEMVKARVDITPGLDEERKAAITEDLDSYINWLEERKQKVEGAENRKELVEIAKEVRKKWAEVRVEMKKIAGEIIISRIDSVLEKGEEIGDRLEAKIEAMKEEGYETGELESLLADYREHMNLARENRDRAKEKFEQISSVEDARTLFREGKGFVKEANRHIRKMFKDLRQIIREIKKKEVRVGGIGFLAANGNGTVVIQGTGSVFVKGDGELTVRVVNGTVRVAGEGEKQENSDGSVTYYGFGKALVAGQDIYVSVTGENLKIRARGKGTATLSGEGTYKAAKKQANWSGEVTYGGGQSED
ncbi:hypothetical protein [Candidatus Pyrohabitans sp.]